MRKSDENGLERAPSGLYSVRARYGTAFPDRNGEDTAMIKRFHVLYVGQVELENIGLQGTPADARRYDNAKLSEPFFAARDVERPLDVRGYHALGTAEHHALHVGYGCGPNLIQRSLWLATQT